MGLNKTDDCRVTFLAEFHWKLVNYNVNGKFKSYFLLWTCDVWKSVIHFQHENHLEKFDQKQPYSTWLFFNPRKTVLASCFEAKAISLATSSSKFEMDSYIAQPCLNHLVMAVNLYSPTGISFDLYCFIVNIWTRHCEPFNYLFQLKLD